MQNVPENKNVVMKKMKLISVFVLCHIFSSLMAQSALYAYVLPIDGKPIIIYADSSMTSVCRIFQPEEFEKVSISVSIRQSSAELFGDKIWLYTEDDGMVPEFTGWVGKERCFRSLKIDSENCSYVYAKPDEDSPCMRILSNRGLLVNVVDFKSDWLKVLFMYHRIIEGWVRKDMLKL